MVARRPAHVAKAPPLCPKDVGVELKREIVEGKEGKEGECGRLATNLLANQPCLASTQSLLSASTLSCSSQAQSSDQKHQKQSQFLSSFSKVLFIYLFFKIDFILYNDEINMPWKRSK
jgi:hypothetical protein